MHVPLCYDVPITLLLFLVGAGLGRRLLFRFALPSADTLERGLFAAALGVGTLSYLPFALFAAGFGHPPCVIAALLLLAILLLPDEIYAVKTAGRLMRGGWQKSRNPTFRPVLFLLAAMVPLLLNTFLKACCPPTDADGLHYHLTAPIYYLNRGRFYFVPTFLHIQWPLGVEMLFGIGLAFHRHFAAGLIQYGMGLLTLTAVYALGRRIASTTVGVMAAAGSFFLLRAEMEWAYVELGLTLYTLLAIYAWFLWRQTVSAEPPFENERGEAVSWAAVSALMAGLAATAKLPGILTVLLLTAMTFGAQWARPTRNVKQALYDAGRFGIIGLLVAAPWYLRSWILTGTPFYPYFGTILHVRDWSPAWQIRLTEFFQVFNTFRSRRLDGPAVLRLRAEVCYLLLAVGFVLCRLRNLRPIRAFIVFLFASVFLQVATSGIYTRYFLFIFPLAALLPLWILRNFLMRSVVLKWSAALFIVLLLWGGNQVPTAVRAEWHNAKVAFPVALGLKSRDAYLAESLPVYPVLRWANVNLPPDATVVLGIQDAYASLLDRNALVTNYWTQDAIRYDTDAGLRSDLKRLGATHLLLHDEPPATPERLNSMDKELRTRYLLEVPKLERLAKQYGIPVHTENSYTLYVLHLPP